MISQPIKTKGHLPTSSVYSWPLQLTLLISFCIALYSCDSDNAGHIDLSGDWQFKIDSADQGIAGKWYTTRMEEGISLPGSMPESGKGNEVTVDTKWTGEILDSAWYFDEKYAPYRKAGNIKIPFWLQPEKHYTGAAWYQKEIDIPASWEDKHIVLHLERPHWETQVWVDSQHAGMRNALGTAHSYPLSDYLKPGKHLLTIRVDNSIKEIDPGHSAHSISDNTQTNWNGIVGSLRLTARPKVFIEQVKLHPDVGNKQVKAMVRIGNLSGEQQQVTLTLQAASKNIKDHKPAKMEETMTVDKEGAFMITYPMGDNPLLWDEFNPNLYTMQLSLKSQRDTDKMDVTFGMREFRADGKQFSINGRPVFLRGTLECAIFPLTGYPSTDVEEWKRIFRICRDHGLNHMRFHSWCPPKAAFEAADESGIYLQVEASGWVNTASSKLGNGDPIDQWLYQEGEDIISAYGNHPSFCMMAYGNEPGGENMKAYLSDYVAHFQQLDSMKVYTGGAGWPFTENADFYNNARPRIQGWGQGLKSNINSEPPQTVFDYSNMVQETPMPYVSHEMGQWCAYPNFKEIEKYTGVLKPNNFKIFKETLEKNKMGHLADSFLLASGKLQALCYKADIEAALRTKDFAGFQLLDLHDFPGQGTALVGVLDAFWDEKGYISPEAYRRFCSETVPLARLEKRIFLNTETFKATLEVAHYGENPLTAITPEWKLVGADGKLIKQGNFSTKDIPLGNGIQLGDISVKLNQVRKAQKLILTVTVGNHVNSWDVWVYPEDKEQIPDEDQILVVKKLDNRAINTLERGGKVLLTITKGDIAPGKGGDIGVGFSSIFWNTAYTSGQKPHTLGILCNPEHPALKAFPTEYHSNWQWWDAMSNSNAIVLDAFPPSLTPVVRVIDDWFENRRTALIFEAQVGKGKLMVSGIDLHTNLAKRYEAQQLLYSLKKYMTSEKFDPETTLDVAGIKELFVYTNPSRVKIQKIQ